MFDYGEGILGEAQLSRRAQVQQPVQQEACPQSRPHAAASWSEDLRKIIVCMSLMSDKISFSDCSFSHSLTFCLSPFHQERNVDVKI